MCVCELKGGGGTAVGRAVTGALVKGGEVWSGGFEVAWARRGVRMPRLTSRRPAAKGAAAETLQAETLPLPAAGDGKPCTPRWQASPACGFPPRACLPARVKTRSCSALAAPALHQAPPQGCFRAHTQQPTTPRPRAAPAPSALTAQMPLAACLRSTSRLTTGQQARRQSPTPGTCC